MIDNDSWRMWPQGREELMLDKQLYRNLEVVTPADLDRVRANYEQVAEIVGTFPQMRPGMVALIADGPEHGAAIETRRARARRVRLAVACATSCRSRARRATCCSSSRSSRRRSRAWSSSRSARTTSALADVLDNATASPVLFVDAAYPRADEIALRCAKAFALEDTVVFGRVLLAAGERALRRCSPPTRSSTRRRRRCRPASRVR